MNKFNKGDKVRVIAEPFKDTFASVYKIKNVLKDCNGIYLYTLLDTKSKRILRTDKGFVAIEEWIEKVDDVVVEKKDNQ